jgi:hypothetical protein
MSSLFWCQFGLIASFAPPGTVQSSTGVAVAGVAMLDIIAYYETLLHQRGAAPKAENAFLAKG